MVGSPNALTALHLRYDPTYKTYLSVEQHLVGEHEYAIFSVNPATRAEKWWNLALYEKLGSRFQIQSFTQYYTQQTFLKEPEAAQQTTFLNATYAFPHSYVSAAAQLTNYNVLGPGSLEHADTIAGNLSTIPRKCSSRPRVSRTASRTCRSTNKSTRATASTTTRVGGASTCRAATAHRRFRRRAFRATARLAPTSTASKIAPVYFCPVYTTIWNTVLGFNLYTPSIKLNNPMNPYETYYFNASFNKQYQWNSLPHWINTSSENFSISRQFSHALNTYVGYQILNTGDYYINGGYTPCHPVNTFYCPLSFTSFRGVSTLRTTSLGHQRRADARVQPLVSGAPPRGLSDSGARRLRTAAEQHHRAAALHVVLRPSAVRRHRRGTLQDTFAHDARRVAHALLVRQSVSHAVLAAHLRGSASADMKRAHFCRSRRSRWRSCWWPPARRRSS